MKKIISITLLLLVIAANATASGVITMRIKGAKDHNQSNFSHLAAA